MKKRRDRKQANNDNHRPSMLDAWEGKRLSSRTFRGLHVRHKNIDWDPSWRSASSRFLVVGRLLTDRRRRRVSSA
jgi:hypothetical protein